MDDISALQAALVVFFFLQVKHFLADFVWQTDRMVLEKGIYGARYGIYHSLIQCAGTFLAFAWIHPTLGLVAAFFDYLAHYHIDWAKININKKYNYTPKDHKFWFWLGLDQLAHQITYILLVGWIFFAF